MNTPTLRFLPFLIFACLLSACGPEQIATPEGFAIHPGFKLELVAAEPLVYDPVDLEFDEKGRAFVLEMPGYPLHDEAGRIVLLEDEDQDGNFDKRTIFADSLGVASSFMHYRGGMLVAAPPDLVWLRDVDGDDQADERTVLMSGFSAGNLQHNFNGLTYGLDNWIYAANGGNNGQPYFAEQPEQKLDLRGGDFRFRIEDQRLERVGESSGGFGLAFDNWGHLFETHNLEHVSHLVFAEHYIKGLPTDPSHTLTLISDHDENGLARIYPIGEQETRVNHPEQSGYFSGACGITFYGGGAFPEGFNNNLFVADVVLNLLHLDVLSPDSAAFKASRMRDQVEFLASSDRAFRPVNLTTGPDGALYLLDMHRTVIEHPEWIPDEIEAELDLKAGREKGRIYRISAREKFSETPLALQPDQPAELVKVLAHPNQWVRLTAQRLLVEANDPSVVPLLEKMYESSTEPLARLHGLWTLKGLEGLKTDLLTRALRDPSPDIRENACKIAENRLAPHPALLESLIELTADHDARVRLQATLSLSLLEEAPDPSVSGAIGDAMVQLVAHPETDTWTTMAVAAAVKQQPVAFSERLLADELNANGLRVVRTLARLIGQQRDLAGSQSILQLLHTGQGDRIEIQKAVIGALANGWTHGQKQAADKSKLASIEKSLEPLEAGNQPTVVRAAGELRNAIGLPVSTPLNKLLEAASAAALDQDKPAEARLANLQLLSLDQFERREALLYRLLDSREPLVLQKEALWQLWQADEPGIAPQLLQRWPELGPEARKHAGDILLYKSQHHNLLLSALEAGSINPGELNLDLERRRVLLFSDDEKVKTRAAALFSDAGVVQRKEAMENMRPALSLPGDIARGKEMYSTLCSQCHRYGSMGEVVGPPLTEINRKSKASLLHDILDPNAAVDTRYINHQLTTNDGNIYTGIIERETDEEISLRMLGGREVALAKKDIKRLNSLGISMMPEGLEGNMNHQEMADLLAFLQQAGEPGVDTQ